MFYAGTTAHFCFLCPIKSIKQGRKSSLCGLLTTVRGFIIQYLKTYDGNCIHNIHQPNLYLGSIKVSSPICQCQFGTIYMNDNGFFIVTSSNGNIFPGEFPTERPVTQRCDVYFDLRSNKRVSKQSRGWWFETPSRPLWRNRNVAFFARWSIIASLMKQHWTAL